MSQKMRIKHVNGSFWNAETRCFSSKEAATVYDNKSDLPRLIKTNNEIVLGMEDHGGGDIRYYPGKDDDALASVSYTLRFQHRS